MPAAPLPSQCFFLRTRDGHRMHVRQAGPATGDPWLVLHGGPGSGCSPSMAAWFDPLRHRVVMPDQRGAGRSRPAGTLRRNTAGALLADLEQLREALGVQRWSVVGGSWGAALALAYAARYPGAVAALVLRGAFLTGRDDIHRLFSPRGGAMLRRVMGRGERLSDARARLLTVSQVLQSGTTVQKLDTAGQWQRAERRMLGLGQTRPGRQPWRERMAAVDKYRIQAHYLRRRAGLGKPALLKAASQIGARDVPVTLLHGRADKVCRPANALRLKAVMPQARLVWVPGGHLPAGAMAEALRAAIGAAGCRR
ncbi:alpha/beta fold hydrolase [Cupriavidus sp. 2MCAB6]|uniref:alpha/beta fold hydrolase n=1 Tax=Cupriavidus sp. 2MCAB6 TaxID=3232981 RepID=UPI003F92D3B4